MNKSLPDDREIADEMTAITDLMMERNTTPKVGLLALASIWIAGLQHSGIDKKRAMDLFEKLWDASARTMHDA
jgi:hypothetical protein